MQNTRPGTVDQPDGCAQHPNAMGRIATAMSAAAVAPAGDQFRSRQLLVLRRIQQSRVNRHFCRHSAQAQARASVPQPCGCFQNRQRPHGMADKNRLCDPKMIDQPDKKVREVSDGRQCLRLCPAMTGQVDSQDRRAVMGDITALPAPNTVIAS